MANIVEDIVVLENVTIAFDKDTGDVSSITVRGYSGDSTPPPTIPVRNGVVDITEVVTTAWKSQVKDKSIDALKEYFDIT